MYKRQPIGGYIVGKKECVENAAYRLTSPGLGKEVGASLGAVSYTHLVDWKNGHRCAGFRFMPQTDISTGWSKKDTK